jgi:hypothetical protein
LKTPLSEFYFLRIFILLYADDVLLISESANALQNALNAFSLYCKQWKLKVNTNKTKIMVFSKRKFGIDSFYQVIFAKHQLSKQYQMPC